MNTQPYVLEFILVVLTFAYSEHLGVAYRAHTLGCRLAILHGYGSGIFDFPLGAAFNTICLHLSLQFFYYER